MKINLHIRVHLGTCMVMGNILLFWIALGPNSQCFTPKYGLGPDTRWNGSLGGMFLLIIWNMETFEGRPKMGGLIFFNIIRLIGHSNSPHIKHGDLHISLYRLN